jgi:hypothetical protein
VLSISKKFLNVSPLLLPTRILYFIIHPFIPVFYFESIILLLLLLLLTAIKFSLGGSIPYTSTDKTNKRALSNRAGNSGYTVSAILVLQTCKKQVNLVLLPQKTYCDLSPYC